ncbi:MAG: MATE family efflux transporter [Clostridia bacterium]|nr:MATE family efflux transporter [Clostridia bacterium]
MQIQLSDKFTYKKLLRFTFPSIIMMVFTSIYYVVDGFFVSNFAGKDAFAAVNFIIPLAMILGCVGFMFGTCGGALIAKTMGEGDKQKANQIFSLVVYVSIILSIVLTVVGLVVLRPVAKLLGAEGQLLADSITYGRILIIAIPAYVLQYEFQCLFATAQKPTLGLVITILAGVTNIALDAIFVAVLKWGLSGAAAATAISQCVGGVVPLIYFACPNKSLLRLTKARWDFRALAKTCANGSSELMTNISMSIVSMLYNVQLLKYIGQDGISAYGVLMYVNMIFLAVFIGYSVGCAPIISYNYGAKNQAELKATQKKSLVIIGVSAIFMFGTALLLAKPLSVLYVGYDQGLLDLTLHAFKIFSFSFLFAGFAIFFSSFFTALNDGVTSAIISFLRTLVFQALAVMLFPLIWEVDGIWISIVVAEIMAVVVSLVFYWLKRKRYGY